MIKHARSGYEDRSGLVLALHCMIRDASILPCLEHALLLRMDLGSC